MAKDFVAWCTTRSINCSKQGQLPFKKMTRQQILRYAKRVLLAQRYNFFLKIMNEIKSQLSICADVFLKKTVDYGTSWRVMRLSSLTDQIFIKAKRIRSIQESGEQKVSDSIETEFIGMVNYCMIALIQLEMPKAEPENLSVEQAVKIYEQVQKETFDLFSDKNHDYDQAWRQMRVSSMVDIILMKLIRIKQIEDNQGQTLISEGVKSGYQDIINYSLFCLVLLGEQFKQKIK